MMVGGPESRVEERELGLRTIFSNSYLQAMRLRMWQVVVISHISVNKVKT